MKLKAQLKSRTSYKKDAKAFKTALSAIEECLAKPPYDYQRIVICRSPRPGLAQSLAIGSGGELIETANMANWKPEPSVLVFEDAGDFHVTALESIVFLVNQTRKVVVIVASGRSVTDWKERHAEILARVRRRTHVTVEFET